MSINHNSGNSEDRPPQQDDALALAAARYRSRTRRRLNLASALLVFFASAVWFGTLLLESGAGRAALRVVELTTRSDAAGDDLLVLDRDKESTEEKPEAAALLPSILDGWTVQGVQPVPGSDGRVIEGNYTPKDEERSLVTPLIVYAQVAADDSDQAQAVIDRALTEKYTDSRRDYAIGGIPVRAGASPDGSSYLLCWVAQERAYAVEASFRYRIPERGGAEPLEMSAQEIAKAIMGHKPGQGGVE